MSPSIVVRSISLMLGALVLAILVVSCSAPKTNRINLPPPIESTTLGPGDTFDLHIVGEDRIPTTYTVSPDGTVDFPYIRRQHVDGLEPQQLVDLVREKLIEGKILMDPSVMVNVREYKSKYVNILGQVKAPGAFPLLPGFTLVQAISQAGGPTPTADPDNVRLTRTTNGKRRTLRISLRSITEGRSPDIPLQSGDVITVAQGVF